MDSYLIFNLLGEMFPNAGCELNYNNDFEFLCAVMLSAQTTDLAVNKVTKVLFEKYRTPYDLSKASILDLEEIIKPIGLAKNKSKYLHSLALKIVRDFNSKVPTERVLIEKLPGVGRKTCNVFLSEIYNIPNIAVDTHVERVSKRIGLVDDNDSVIDVERHLQAHFKEEDWINLHHRLLFLGRYLCKSKKPGCDKCLLKDICEYRKGEITNERYN